MMLTNPGRLLMVLCLGALPLWANGQELPRHRLSVMQAAAVDRAVLAEMASQEIVGVAVGIIRDGHIVYLQGFGLADRESGTSVTTDTVFNLASIMKPMTAVAAMQLVEMGLLDLDANIRDYVPEYPDPGAVITSRHLLCHQSGLPHYTNGPVIGTEREYTDPHPFLDPILALDRFNRSPLMFTPGAEREYSTPGYILLTAVIHRAGKKPFAEQIEERIAAPLGMTTLTLDMPTEGQPNWATGYIRTRAGKIVRAPEQAHYIKQGAGGHKSTIGDLARFAAGLLNRELVSEESETAMWTPQRTSKGEVTTTGLGFRLDERDGALRVWHNGLQDEATTRMVLFPEKQYGIVVMTNCRFTNPTAITDAVHNVLR